MQRPLNRLSVIIIAKNEAERIEECLRSVAWADEIIVVDSGSSDETVQISKRYTDRVYLVPWRGFGRQKQAAVDLASNEWILNIDCDERMTPELADEIRAILAADNSVTAYSVPRRTFIGNKEIKHCGWYPDRTVRLFRRSKAQYSDSMVHERVEVSGSTNDCSGHLLHFSFSGIGPMLTKTNLYSDLSAGQMFDAGRSCSFFDLTIKPLAAFLKTYCIKAGVLDGIEGLTVSLTTALVTYAKYAKLRELNLSARQSLKTDRK